MINISMALAIWGVFLTLLTIVHYVSKVVNESSWRRFFISLWKWCCGYTVNRTYVGKPRSFHNKKLYNCRFIQCNDIYLSGGCKVEEVYAVNTTIHISPEVIVDYKELKCKWNSYE